MGSDLSTSTGTRTAPPLELRVHGVSGTPPESLLDRPLVVQLAGDRLAGFYRPRLREESRDDRPDPLTPLRPAVQVPDPSSAEAPELEGYCWGGLTSGSPGRALWLLLLPFTLVNLSVRARPDYGTGHRALTAWLWAVTRLLGLALTGLFVLTAVGVGQTLVAVRCPSAACAAPLPGVLAPPLQWLAVDLRTTTLVGALVPAVMLLGLWAASAGSANRYELVSSRYTSTTGEQHRRPASVAADEVESSLASPGMWHNADTVKHLRAGHLQLGFALIAMTLTWGSGWVVVPTVLAVGTALDEVRRLLATRGAGWARFFAARIWRVVGWVLAVVSLALAVGRCLTADDGFAVVTAQSAGFDVLLAVVGGLAVGLPVVVLGLNVRARSNAATVAAALDDAALAPMLPQRAGCAGLSMSCLAGFGVFFAFVFTGGIYLYGSAYLRTGSLRPSLDEVATVVDPATGKSAMSPVIVSGALSYVAALVWLLLVVLAVAVWALVRQDGLVRRGPVTDAILAADYPDDVDGSGLCRDADDREARARLGSIRRAVVLGGLVDAASPAMLWLAGGVLAAAVLGAALAVAPEAMRDAVPRWLVQVEGVGAYLAVLTLVALVGLGSLAFRVPATRRSVGILWDVASFWPRTAHPLAAPCYAERTVPDLVTRLSWLLNEQSRRVVLAAHSQGTVISVAAILHLQEAVTSPPTALSEGREAVVDLGSLDDLSLLTFGCVLRRLYGRYFPAYFGPTHLRTVVALLGGEQAQAPRWVNLWRYTDYLGGQVTAGPPHHPTEVAPLCPEGFVPVVGAPQPWEWHCPDPASFVRAPGDTAYPRPKRHSDFWSDPSGFFQLAALHLTGTTPHPPRAREEEGGG